MSFTCDNRTQTNSTSQAKEISDLRRQIEALRSELSRQELVVADMLSAFRDSLAATKLALQSAVAKQERQYQSEQR
jgi:hypothetical protein